MPDGRDYGLTSRQQQVVHLVIQGMSNKEIARQLHISDGTVKLHLNSAYRTLGVTSRGKLVALMLA